MCHLQIFEADLIKILGLHKETKIDNIFDAVSILSDNKDLKSEIIEKNLKTSVSSVK